MFKSSILLALCSRLETFGSFLFASKIWENFSPNGTVQLFRQSFSAFSVSFDTAFVNFPLNKTKRSSVFISHRNDCVFHHWGDQEYCEKPNGTQWFPIIPVKMRKAEHSWTYFYFSLNKIYSEMGHFISFPTGTSGFPYKWKVTLVRLWQRACPCKKGKICDVNIFLHSW